MYKKLLLVFAIFTLLLAGCSPTTLGITDATTLTPDTTAPQADSPKSCTYDLVEYAAGTNLRIAADTYLWCNGVTGQFGTLVETPDNISYTDVRPVEKTFNANDCKPDAGYKVMPESATLGYCAYEKIPAPQPIVPAPTSAPQPAPVATCQSKMDISTDGGKTWTPVGNDFEDRLAYTNGEALTNHVAPYVGAELKKVETTPVSYTMSTCPGTYAVVFAGGAQVNNRSFEDGVAFVVAGDGSTITMTIRNGEAVIWKSFMAMQADLSKRMSDEIAKGNLSIHAPLAWHHTSPEISGYFPKELLDARKVDIVQIVQYGK